MSPALKFTTGCSCGKVQLLVETLERAPPLRLVCYCKDCRGYYETLNRIATSKGMPPAAVLDNWGGVDWTALHARDITIQKGRENLRTCKIRDNSNVKQVYATCCNTPLLRFGAMSVLMNSNIIPKDLQPDVEFRIIGRDSWKKGILTNEPKPNMNWSVPFRWFWTMPKWADSELMKPSPIDMEKEPITVLEGFQEGSKSAPVKTVQ